MCQFTRFIPGQSHVLSIPSDTVLPVFPRSSWFPVRARFQFKAWFGILHVLHLSSIQGSRASWKVLESSGTVLVKFPGRGMARNLLSSDADATPKYARLHISILSWNSFFAVCLQHATVMNIYSSMDAAIIYMVSNCCLSLYLNIAGLRQGRGKMLLGSWKSPGFFCNRERWNPVRYFC